MAATDDVKSDGMVIQFPRLHALLRYWSGKCMGRPMPMRADIDPVEIPSLLPIAVLGEVKAGEVRLRLMGEEALAGYGRDVRGRRIQDLDLGAFTRPWVEAFELAISTGAPAGAAGVFARDGRPCRIEAVLLPLAGATGAISHVFGGLIIKSIPRDELARGQAAVIHVLPLPRRNADEAELQPTRMFRAGTSTRGY